MADVLKIVFLVVGTLVVLVAYWLAAVALFPAAVARARDQYERGAARATLLGVAAGVPASLLAAALLGQAGNPAFRLAGGAIAAALLLLGLLGSAGLGERIGRGLPSAGDERHPWRRTLRGGVVLSLTFLLPVVGWFVVLPWTLVSGLGAAIAAARRRRAAALPERIPTPVPDAA